MFLKFRKYHKMEFSYYPIMFGLGVLGIDFGLVLFMSMGIFCSFFICLLYLLYVSFLWMKDVFLEDVSGQYSFYDYRMFSQGFRLFLFSELTLFFSIFWTFLDSSLCPLTWLGGVWSPVGILSPDYLGINGMASLFLMMNSQVLKYSRRYLCLNVNKCENLLLLCIFIGSFFLCFQFFEYSHNCFVMNDSIYGSVFYIGTGLHGSHVLIGVCFLIVNFFRAKLHNFNWYHTQAYDMSIDYWRFLEWMWGIMFCLLYVWGS
uniref:Cytochrome c oxidase subunit 3 n=1 Tax=Brugia malayi TaxID=6279 RepID=Q8HN50_BRUMA|nr:cytochrome c oxidase subunit III [Brugia malayi]AAN17809.1 cytochrome c oxidase subunit III [Brugia malayi]QTZ19038.1 cytochrome c oxidase subunit III [Brugia malayi]